MKSTEKRAFLESLYTERLTLFHRHVEGAKKVADYEFNNTYQYIIGREEIHLQWVRDAVTDLGGTAPTTVPNPLPIPSVQAGVSGGEAVIYADDAKHMTAFVERWRPRLASLTNARHRKMLDLMMGEMREHARLFAQAAAGVDDVLGTRMPGASTGDGVLPVRWME